MKLKIMIPVDFTPVSAKAIEFLNFLTDRTPVEIHLVHVIQVNEADWGCSSENSETVNHLALKAQEQEAYRKFSDLKQQVDFTFYAEVVYGGLTTQLAQYAKVRYIDLVIMGTKGADGWLEKISGSEAQHLVRHIEIPVITIHEHASINPVNKILWVADFKEKQKTGQAIEVIQKLQSLFNAQINLLQIMEKDDEKRETEFRQNMQQFADNFQLEQYQMHLRRNYQVPQGVKNFNEESDMDLVLIGTHGRNGFSQIFYGSVAETLVNHCIRPLLTYHIS